MFYLILFLDAKLDTLMQYMTLIYVDVDISCVFAANSQQRIRIGKRYKWHPIFRFEHHSSQFLRE